MVALGQLQKERGTKREHVQRKDFHKMEVLFISFSATICLIPYANQKYIPAAFQGHTDSDGCCKSSLHMKLCHNYLICP